jgi:hypothetical protein
MLYASMAAGAGFTRNLQQHVFDLVADTPAKAPAACIAAAVR